MTRLYSLIGAILVMVAIPSCQTTAGNAGGASVLRATALTAVQWAAIEALESQPAQARAAIGAIRAIAGNGEADLSVIKSTPIRLLATLLAGEYLMLADSQAGNSDQLRPWLDALDGALSAVTPSK